MQAMEALLTRNSATRLCEPAPQGAVREAIFQAALRVPDHARLRPWRFLVIEGEDRQRLGELMVATERALDPGLAEDKAERLRQKPLRAPLLVVVAAEVSEHPKVPELEQLLSAGCAAMNILLACHAQGFAAIWRSGRLIFEPGFASGLGLDAEHHRIVGVLYIGSPEGEPKPLPELNPSDYFRTWPAPG